MATLILEVNAEVLKRAKERAMLLNTTVEHLLARSLIGIADEPNPQAEAFAALQEWAKQHPFSVDTSSYTRDELHERP